MCDCAMISCVVPHRKHEAEVLVIFRGTFVACAATANGDQIRRTRVREECLGRNMIVRKRFCASTIQATAVVVFCDAHSGHDVKCTRAFIQLYKDAVRAKDAGADDDEWYRARSALSRVSAAYWLPAFRALGAAVDVPTRPVHRVHPVQASHPVCRPRQIG